MPRRKIRVRRGRSGEYFLSSSHVSLPNTRTVPYTPSYPGSIKISPRRTRSIPSAVRSSEAKSISAIGASMSTDNSVPNRSISRPYTLANRLRSRPDAEALRQDFPQGHQRLEGRTSRVTVHQSIVSNPRIHLPASQFLDAVRHSHGDPATARWTDIVLLAYFLRTHLGVAGAVPGVVVLPLLRVELDRMRNILSPHCLNEAVVRHLPIHHGQFPPQVRRGVSVRKRHNRHVIERWHFPVHGGIARTAPSQWLESRRHQTAEALLQRIVPRLRAVQSEPRRP